MNRLRLLLVVFWVIGSSAFAQGELLDSFDSLIEALKSGKEVRMVVDYGDSRLIAGNKEEVAPRATGGMVVDTWEYFAENTIYNDQAFVVFSESKLIANPRGEGYVYNYVKIRVNADDSVRLIARYLQPLTLETLMDESFYTTVFDGSSGAAKFYK